jgi:hypothetical protein
MPMIAYLVPVGRGQFAVYAEPSDGPPPGPSSEESAVGRWTRRLTARWHLLVEEARRRESRGRLGRWTDAAVIQLAESLAEQRTMWRLRTEPSATLHYPSGLPEPDARVGLMSALKRERRRRGWLLARDGLLLVVSGALVLLPGPNLVAYYFVLRVVGHVYSWRGATHGERRVNWSVLPDDDLAGLVSLADLPHAARAERVVEIADRLRLAHLAAFFDRVSPKER